MTRERSELEGLISAPESTAADAQAARTPARSRDRSRPRLVAAGIVAAIIAVFAVVNVNDVKVHWVVTTGRTPLIVVIALSFLLGMVVDRLAVRARRKRRP